LANTPLISELRQRQNHFRLSKEGESKGEEHLHRGYSDAALALRCFIDLLKLG
jgi:hypothetical protein